MSFAEIIVRYRKELGLTQEALAQKLGVTNQAVSKWESGQSCPDIALLPALADLFGITIDALFGRAPKALAVQNAPDWPDDGVLRVVLYAGHRQISAPTATTREIHFCYEGPALNIESAVSIYCDDVMGNVTAGENVTCDDVYGSISAQGSVTCDDVQGEIRAGGSVTCDCAEGEIHAGGNVTCDEASGDIRAGGNVYCEHWER